MLFLWLFFFAIAETPVLWPPHAKSWLIGKDSDAGRDWGQEEKGMTEDEMAGWHHRLDGHESEWTPGVSDGQGGLACCNSWGRKESDTTERLNWLMILTVDFPNLPFIVLKKVCVDFVKCFFSINWIFCSENANNNLIPRSIFKLANIYKNSFLICYLHMSIF